MSVMRSLAQEMQLTPLSVQGSVGCVGPLVSVEFTAGEGAPPRSRIHALTLSTPGHLSLGPRSKLPGGWSPGFWSHLCFKLALPPGSVTIPPSSGLSCCNVRNGVRSLTKIPHHKERLEVQTNVEPVSECLTSLCPLVDTSSLAPGGNRLETPELCDLSQGSPPLRYIKCG